MKVINTLLFFCLLSFSIDSFPQQYSWPNMVRMTFKTASNVYVDDIVIRFSDDSTVTTQESDYWDVRTLNTVNFLASLKGTASFAIQTRPLNFDRDTVGIRVVSANQGNFVFRFTEFENFIVAKEIILLDTYTGLQQNVKLLPVYNFSIDANAESQGRNRFKLVFVSEQIFLNAPSNIVTDNLPGQNGANVNFAANATGKCGAVNISYSKLPGSFFEIGTTTVTVTGTDACGNQLEKTFTVTVRDIESPVIATIQTEYFSTNAGTCSYNYIPVPPNATDNSGNAVVNGVRSDGEPLAAPFKKGTTAITWTATDASGNTATSTQQIIVSDNEAPVIVAKPLQQEYNINASCSYKVNGDEFDPGYSDVCSQVSITNNYNNSNSLAGAVLPLGITTITWTATDATGNIATISQQINITEKDPPVIIAKQLQQEYNVNNTSCSYKVNGGEFDPAYSDACSQVSIINNYNNSNSLAGAVFPVGLTNVTWTATDASGNTSSWTERINIVSQLKAAIPDTSALTVGVQANTIYIGYSPASILTYTQKDLNLGYVWSTSSNLSISGANNTSSVNVTATTISTQPYILNLQVTNALGCTATASKNLEVVNVACGTKNDKVLLCSPQGRTQCISNNQSILASLTNGSTLGSCSSSARGTSSFDMMQTQAASVSAYPNPTKGTFILKMDGFKQGMAELTVIDMLGRTVINRNVNITQQKENIVVDLSNKTAGVYNIRISTQEGMQFTKVVLVQ